MCSQLKINPPKPEENQPPLSLPDRGIKTQGRAMCLASEQGGVRKGIKALVGTTLGDRAAQHRKQWPS